MKDKILNFIMAILVILFLVIAMFKTSPKDFQNKVYRKITIIKIQYLGKIDKNGTNSDTKSSANKQKLDEPNFEPYMQDLQKRIKAKWEPPKRNESKKVIVLFKIAKNGELLKIRIFKTSGVFAVDNAALKAVKDAAPFRPLPKEFKDKSIDIQFTFDYNVLNKKFH